MNEPIKSKIVFDSDNEQPVFTEETLNDKQLFSDEDAKQFHVTTIDNDIEQENAQLESELVNVLKPKRSIWRKMVSVGMGLFGISVVAQTVSWISQSIQQQDWINLGAACAGGLIVVAGIGAVITEWRHLYRLRERAEERDIATELLSSHGIEKGREFCEKIAKQAGLSTDHPAFTRWQKALHSTHSDREVVELYAKIVQPVLDQQARRQISRYAAESTLMIAVSPLALVDMAFIAWRNLRLINQIAKIYGIELGYFSRLKLFRLVLINIAFAGATELIREVGMDWLSQDLAAKLSARAAQGIGAGLLTARLGIKAMELCRPLPWIDNDKPRLADFRKELLGQLKTIIPGKKSI